MIDVSVPCACGADIHLRDTACPSCKTPVSRELREALEERLESSHPEYREAKDRVRHTAMGLLAIGILHAAVGVLVYTAGSHSDLVPAGRLEDQGEMLSLLVNLALGGVFIACWRAADRAPVAALFGALACWLLVRAGVAAASPAGFLASFLSIDGVATLLGRVVVLLVLVRGVSAARRLRKLTAEMARAPA